MVSNYHAFFKIKSLLHIAVVSFSSRYRIKYQTIFCVSVRVEMYRFSSSLLCVDFNVLEC